MTPPKNTLGGPRFDLPKTTVTPSQACELLAMHTDQLLELVGGQKPMPELLDPVTAPFVADAPEDAEPLVEIDHRRIRILSNYWHAGWSQAGRRMSLRSGAAQAFGRAADSLPDRFGLAVFDAYRPLVLQAELYDAAYADPTLPPGFVAEPIADRTTPPPHSTGGTVDCTLTIDGIPLALGTDFDDFTDDAWTAAFESRPGPDRELRRLLYWTMRRAGFVVLHCEWWHFELGTRRWGAITGNTPRYRRADPA